MDLFFGDVPGSFTLTSKFMDFASDGQPTPRTSPFFPRPMAVSDIVVVVACIRASVDSKVIVALESSSERLDRFVLTATRQKSVLQPLRIIFGNFTMHIKKDLYK